MPLEEMTWVDATRRWAKKHKRHQYFVGPRILSRGYPQLFREATREGSRDAANQWWHDKLAELSVLSAIDPGDAAADDDTLRDLFATHAMRALIPFTIASTSPAVSDNDLSEFGALAQRAYACADAMLAAKKKKSKQT